jgi:hypothetical protein
MSRPPDRAELLLAVRRCSQCLLGSAPIVGPSRVREIVKACRSEDVHFRCHKADAEGLNVHCRGVHEVMGGARAYRMAVSWNISIREVDCDAL